MSLPLRDRSSGPSLKDARESLNFPNLWKIAMLQRRELPHAENCIGTETVSLLKNINPYGMYLQLSFTLVYTFGQVLQPVIA